MVYVKHGGESETGGMEEQLERIKGCMYVCACRLTRYRESINIKWDVTKKKKNYVIE